MDEDYLDRFLAINLKGTFFLSQAVIPHMREVGGGAIINVGTVLVEHALGGFPASAAVSSKGAIHALTVQLAAEFGKDNIRVNTIAPGIIRTPIHARNGIENADSLAGLHLVDRIGEPEEIAEVAAQLATNAFISGTVINVTAATWPATTSVDHAGGANRAGRRSHLLVLCDPISSYCCLVGGPLCNFSS